MSLDGLEQVSSVDISELVVPDFGVIFVNGSSIDIPPQSEGGFSIAKDYIQEGDYLIFFPFLLALLVIVFVVIGKNTILKI